MWQEALQLFPFLISYLQSLAILIDLLAIELMLEGEFSLLFEDWSKRDAGRT